MENLIRQIDSLKPDTQAVWGKMSAQHMVEHLSGVFWISAGKIKVGCHTPAEKLPVMRKFLESERPMPRNFVSPAVGENLLPLRFSAFEEAVEDFKKAHEAFLDYFEKQPDAKLTNPAFGDLNFEEWKQFHRKHITHHFTQFGLL